MRAAVVSMVLLCGIAQGAEPKTVTNSIGMVLIEIPAGNLPFLWSVSVSCSQNFVASFQSTQDAALLSPI